jgi:hypothetical protein
MTCASSGAARARDFLLRLYQRGGVYLTAGARHTLVDNFHRLVALDELAAGALALPAFELSAAAVNAHHEESTLELHP